MEYHADRDSYICRNGRELTVANERRSKTASGYVSVKTYYRSPDCTGCPYKTVKKAVVPRQSTGGNCVRAWNWT